MNYYLDITLLPDAEANLGFLWQKMFTQVHLALVENKLADGNSAVAVSFPEYACKSFPLGSKLRLFAKTEEQLTKLELSVYLKRFTDYCHCTSIKAVPSVERYVQFQRRRFDTNMERQARRRAKRKGESLEQALAHYEGFSDEQSSLPFINLHSLSGGEKFRLFVERKMCDKALEGTYTCYGLSCRNQAKSATVPWF